MAPLARAEISRSVLRALPQLQTSRFPLAVDLRDPLYQDAIAPPHTDALNQKWALARNQVKDRVTFLESLYPDILAERIAQLRCYWQTHINFYRIL